MLILQNAIRLLMLNLVGTATRLSIMPNDSNNVTGSGSHLDIPLMLNSTSNSRSAFRDAVLAGVASVTAAYPISCFRRVEATALNGSTSTTPNLKDVRILFSNEESWGGRWIRNTIYIETSVNWGDWKRQRVVRSLTHMTMVPSLLHR